MRKYQAALLTIILTLAVCGTAFAQEQLDESYEIKGGNSEESMYDTRDYQEDYGEAAEAPTGEDWGQEEQKRRTLKDGWGGEGNKIGESNQLGDAPKKIVVQEGDTLWDLCSTHLGNPWYWQKVWAMNKHIANPHWIYPGNVIYFSEMPGSGAMVSAGSEAVMVGDEGVGTDELGHIPDILNEQEWGDVAEGGKYRIKDYFTTVSGMGYDFYNFRRDGFIAYKELQYTGKITNAPEENILLTEGDIIYIKPHDKEKMDFKIGKTYQIFRQGQKVKHPATGDKLGVKVEILGACEVIRLSSKNVATARITQSYSEIERGDLVRPWNDPVRDMRPRRNKVSVQGYVVARMSENEIITEHQIVYLDKGVSHGIEEGNRLFVIRKIDYESPGGLKKDDLPFEKIGELVVLSAGHQTSVAMVATSLIGIEVGDKVIMEKNY